MRRLLLVAALAMAGCGATRRELGYVTTYHDDKRAVTCWQAGNAISCLPDWQLVRPTLAPCPCAEKP